MRKPVDSLFVPAVLVLSFACSSDNGTKPPAGDTTPPGTVETLCVLSPPGRVLRLSWVAPGDDGMEGRAARYDLRYSADSLTEQAWAAATPVANLPVPGPSDQWETLTLPMHPLGSWCFALKTADEVQNWSAISNTIRVTVADLVPPGAVTDLAVTLAGGQNVALSWTAPGNDGAQGTVVAYDLRYALSSITQETWADATRVSGVPAPHVAGTTESFTVTGLETGQTYYFGLKARDEQPNWSPLSNVVSATPTAGTVRRLTTGPAEDSQAWCPTWSPDGQNIAFEASWGQGMQIYRVPSGGGTPIWLAEGSNPAWSPNGQRIAFIEYVTLDLWVMDANGSQATLVSHPSQGYFQQPAWSPDGARLACVNTAYWDPGQPYWQRIYIVPLAGGAPVRLTLDSSANYSPSWSPDGTRIAFSSDRGRNFDIWVMPAVGGDAVQLTHDPGRDDEPCWSPDGTKIAFSSNRTGQAQIWIMSATGDGLMQLTSGQGMSGTPRWSPDGNQIAYCSNDSPTSRHVDIWILTLR